MTFLEKNSKKLGIPSYFVLVMNKLAVNSPCAFKSINTEAAIDRVMIAFSEMAIRLCSSPGDEYAVVLEHVKFSTEGEELSSYKAPIGVRCLIECMQLKNIFKFWFKF